MGEVARCCSTPHAAMNSDEASLVCESSMDFGLLFGDEVTTGKEGMHHQREEYRTFLYLRVLRRLCASDEPRQRKVCEFVMRIKFLDSLRVGLQLSRELNCRLLFGGRVNGTTLLDCTGLLSSAMHAMCVGT